MVVPSLHSSRLWPSLPVPGSPRHREVWGWGGAGSEAVTPRSLSRLLRAGQGGKKETQVNKRVQKTPGQAPLRLSKGRLFVTDSVGATPHSSERVRASRILAAGKGRGTEPGGEQEAPEGAGHSSREMRHSLNPQIIDRAASLLKGPQCLLQPGGGTLLFPVFVAPGTGAPVTLDT